ncbi:abc transporter c family member 8 [Quercus suber]|uniref:Abc transporter c family member 8 n=1 Tax=Quercus suber TaxID=58331 RepID=A0AAW0J5H6_QUESU
MVVRLLNLEAEELLTDGTAFEQLVNAHRDAITGLGPSNNGTKEESQKLDTVQPEVSQGSNLTKENSEGEIAVKDLPGVQLTEEEETEINDVGWKPFWDYIDSKGLLLFFLGIVTQAVYTAISTLSALFVYVRSFQSLFSGFTNAVFKAPMLFFDSTPVGQILTRASSDLSILDYNVPFSTIFVVAARIMASVTWEVLIVAILAMVAAKYFQGYYKPSMRELIRINGTTKAPVMNYAAETSLEVVTIRAFNMTDKFFENYLKLIDSDAQLFFYSNAAMEWLNLTLFTAAFLLVLLPNGFIAPGNITSLELSIFCSKEFSDCQKILLINPPFLGGLQDLWDSLSYALSLTGTQIFLTRWYSSLSNYIISVEQIKQFMHVPSEPPAIVEDTRPLISPALSKKGLESEFCEEQDVGKLHFGKILVDGLDICFIGLKDLRMKLSIIPQEPTLFKGSMWTNLDPLGLNSDDDIWKALEKCQLKATISSLPNLLDSSVSDEGENWSAGQRQLFCLGRVLLKRNKILVLDEATASIDSATDAVLQRIIRQEFSECTVITVAHEFLLLLIVIWSWSSLMTAYANLSWFGLVGKLIEYVEPSKLLETNSSFAKLVAEYWSSSRRNSYQDFNKYQ